MYKKANTSMDSIFIFKCTCIVQENIFLLIKQIYNSDKLRRHLCEPEKPSPPPGPSSLDSNLTKKRKAWEEHYVLQRDKWM